MSQYQFISYKPTPMDQYMMGVATVRLYGKVVLRFKHVKTKDGKGDFFTAPSYSIDENGEKKYLQSFMLDSRAEDEELMDFVREGYKAHCRAKSAPVQSEPLVFPFGLTDPQNYQVPQANQPGLPF
jgi:hypothetical protein